MRQHYLLIYDRSQGSVRMVSFSLLDAALTARFNAEREFSDDPEIEIVVLSADSHEDLARTHSRYLKGLHDRLNQPRIGRLNYLGREVTKSCLSFSFWRPCDPLVRLRITFFFHRIDRFISVDSCDRTFNNLCQPC